MGSDLTDSAKGETTLTIDSLARGHAPANDPPKSCAIRPPVCSLPGAGLCGKTVTRDKLAKRLCDLSAWVWAT